MYTVHSLIGVREAEEKVKFEMLEFIHNCLIFILHERWVSVFQTLGMWLIMSINF